MVSIVGLVLTACQASQTTDKTTENALNVPKTFEIVQKIDEKLKKEEKNEEINQKTQENAQKQALPSRSARLEYTDEDLKWLAHIVSAEARDEPKEGQIAVANVVLNRVASGNEFPDTIKSVVFQKRQFSPTMNGSIYDEPTQESLDSAQQALRGKRVIPSDVYYFYDKRYVSHSWLDTRKQYGKIGHHTFTY